MGFPLQFVSFLGNCVTKTSVRASARFFLIHWSAKVDKEFITQACASAVEEAPVPYRTWSVIEVPVAGRSLRAWVFPDNYPLSYALPIMQAKFGVRVIG